MDKGEDQQDHHFGEQANSYIAQAHANACSRVFYLIAIHLHTNRQNDFYDD